MFAKGLMLTSGMVGGVCCVGGAWAKIVVPCGMDASWATVGGSLGCVVCGTSTHRPGSRCCPLFRLGSEIC